VLYCSWAKSAVAVALQQYRQLQGEAQGKPVFIAEIGWPSRSGEVDSSRSRLEHAAAFAQAWVLVSAHYERAPGDWSNRTGIHHRKAQCLSMHV
jgi:hypothetical protein